VYNPGGNTFNTAANATTTTSNVSCAADTHHAFNRDRDKTILTASAFDSDNTSTQHDHPRRDCCLPARFRTGEYVPTTVSHTPARSRLLTFELANANSVPPSNDEEFDTRNTNSALQQLDISSISGARNSRK
jgi:hypothetical protein